VEDLGGLIDRELVDPDAAASQTYAFHHALTREVAYGLMVRNQRRALHRALAEFYESGEGELDHLYAVLAHHWLRAEDDAKAVHYLARAAVSSLANGMPRESVMQGVRAARILGIQLETDPARIIELLPAELAAIDELMADRRPGDLAGLPELVDEDVATGIAIVLQTMPSAHQSLQTELFALMAIRNLNLTLRFGAGSLAACVHAMYSIVLRGLGADRELAYEFSQLARNVDAGAGAPNAGVVNFVHAWFNNHWRNPYAAGVPIALAGAEVGLAGSDLLYGSFNLAAATTLTAHGGAPLADVVAMAERHLERIGPRSSTASFHNRLEMQVAHALAGRTGGLASLTGEGVDEQDLAAMTQTENFNQAGFYHVAKLRLLYLCGRAAEALESAALAERLLPSFLGQVGQIDLTVYGALSRLAVLPGADAGASEPVRQALSELEVWSAACPENFADKLALVRGELHAVGGRYAEADALFAEAEAHATANDLVQWAALARERRGHAARAAGATTAAGHFAAAAEHYRSWGAAAKAAELAALAG
jgi:predicted ATPase